MKEEVEAEFVAVFTKNIEDLFPNMSGSAFRVLFLLLKESKFPLDQGIYRTKGNVVLITQSFRSEWAEKLEMSLGALNNIMTILLRKELLLVVNKPIYILNPHYFFKGSNVQRKQAIKEINSSTRRLKTKL